VLVALLLAGSAWWIWFRLYSKVTLEDAFITYRYATNLALGKGFVFNEGERVLGTTTPLLTLILACFGRLVSVDAIPRFSSVAMVLLGITTGGLSYVVARKLGLQTIAGPASVVLFFGSSRITVGAVGGMETPLVLFFMALSLYLLLAGEYTWCAVVGGLLVLTRIDGAIWFTMLLVAIYVKDRRNAWKGIALSTALLLPWLVFSRLYFGSVLPNSVAAKGVLGSIQLPPLLSFADLKLFSHWYSASLGYGIRSWVFPIWLGFVILGIVRLTSDSRTRLAGVVLTVFPAALGLFMYFGHAPHFDWYPSPALWTVVLLCAVGVGASEAWLRDVLRRRQFAEWPTGVLMVCLAVAYVVSQNHGLADYYYRAQANEDTTRRSVGLWLRDKTRNDSVVAMEAIGYQGFFCERRVVDLGGLVTPEVVAIGQRSRSNAEAFGRILARFKPDYVVLRCFEVEENRHFYGGRLFESAAERDSFVGLYGEAARFGVPYPEVWSGVSCLTILERRHDAS
jgi:hypothetical protein